LVIGVGLAAAAGMGAVGGIVANIALTPLTAGAGLLQSYWYGSGLILGERMMYTVHWEKIKARLDKGENFMDILDQEMNDDITAVAMLSFKAMDKTAEIFHAQATISLGKFIEDLISAALNPFFSGERIPSEETSPDTEIVLLSLTQSEISAANDLVLAAWIKVITEYDSTTQALLLTEQARRVRTAPEPEPELPTSDQIYATRDQALKAFLLKYAPWSNTDQTWKYWKLPLLLKNDLQAFAFHKTSSYQNYLLVVNGFFASTKQLWLATDPNNTQYAIREAIHNKVVELILEVNQWMTDNNV